MAKSTLDFIDRLNVKVLTGSPVLTKDDCGRVFVLNSTDGHTIILPSVHEAGPGWHARFVVGTVQTSLLNRAFSSISAPGTETLSLERRALDVVGAVTNTGVNLADKPALQFNNNPPGPADDNDKFTVTVGAAAGGTGTEFEFELVADVAELNSKTAAAGKFFVITNADKGVIATSVKAALEGVESANVKPPPAGNEGAIGSPVRGRFTVAVAVNNLRFTMTVPGTAAPAAILTADGVADGDICIAANVNLIGGGTNGVNQTAFVLDTRTIQIHPSGTSVGDVVDVQLVNGAWRARSRSAS